MRLEEAKSSAIEARSRWLSRMGVTECSLLDRGVAHISRQQLPGNDERIQRKPGTILVKK